MSTATKTKREHVFTLWKRQSKDGKKSYFSGRVENTGENLTAFYNTNKKNLKEPDLRVYLRDDSGNLSKEPFVDLWCNPTNKGKKILSGKFNGKPVIGFINENASVYVFNDLPVAEVAKEEKQEAKTNKGKKFEELSQEELPF